ncbi:MAG: hypothetical protein M0038_17790 [Pseudomonadota bacterium]|jgi:hypothetical protein|nr:hypothetical protein [Pseudomonadota bacterium]
MELEILIRERGVARDVTDLSAIGEIVERARNPRVERTVALHVYAANLMSLKLGNRDSPKLAETRFRFNTEGQMADVR